MSAVRHAKRVSATLLAALAGLALVSSVVYAAAAKPGITVQISPTSQSVERAKAVTYTVTLTSTGGFTGAVTMSASGLPAGASASFKPAITPALTASGAGSAATSVLTVTTLASTPLGSYTLTVTGTSGKVIGSVTAGLKVTDPQPGSLSMSATPTSITVAPGAVASYAIQLVRTRLNGDVNFSLTGLPAGATAGFNPNPVTGTATSSTLQVITTTTMADGAYTLNLVASGKDGTATRYAYASVQLVVKTVARSFSISGNVSGLAPGKTSPLELSLTNPNAKSLSVTSLKVTLLSVTRTRFAINNKQPCLIGDYGVVQFTGSYPLVVPGSSTKTLSELGVDGGQRPQIKFINTSVNQDGCKGATLTLSYSGSGQGN